MRMLRTLARPPEEEDKRRACQRLWEGKGAAIAISFALSENVPTSG